MRPADRGCGCPDAGECRQEVGCWWVRAALVRTGDVDRLADEVRDLPDGLEVPVQVGTLRRLLAS
jgi:hypothetical protein